MRPESGGKEPWTEISEISLKQKAKEYGRDLQSKATSFLQETTEKIVNEDCLKNVPDILKGYGYNCETLETETEDGFLITIHRVPNPGGVPILLQHGFQGDSGNFVYGGPSEGE